MATLEMEHLASDWQLKPGWEYDGVPILNHTKSGFFLKCRTKKEFVGGNSIKFMPYVNADYFQVTVDGDEVASMEGHALRLAPGHIVETSVLRFDRGGERSVEVTVGVLKEQRSWVMFAWSRVHSYDNRRDDRVEEEDSFTEHDKVACGTTPICHGPRAHCPILKKGLNKGEKNWGYCKSFAPSGSNDKCIVYSFGIRDLYTAELLYGREGCDVYAFDCTVSYPEELGANVTFKPWCLGSDSSELKLDGKESQAMQTAKNAIFMDLPSIVKTLGHEEDELTILKMDCEGCEWNALDALLSRMPEFFSRIRMLLLELHFVTNLPPGSRERTEEIRTIARVMDSFREYRTFSFGINSDLSVERFAEGIFYDELYNSGLFVGACCYEISMVRKGITPRRARTPFHILIK